jgi:hypothetical protein
MAAEVQPFAGHLLVVGGRAVSMAPPGALAELAPKRALRAREGDAFFILVTPAEGTRAPSALYEELARLGADTYFGSSGGVTSGLREALGAIHRHLGGLPGEPGERKRVNALALVLRGAELYAARSGKTFGAVYQGAELALFPADRRDPLMINLPPLGLDGEPEIQFGMYEVIPGQSALLADMGLLEADDAALQAALSGDTVRAVLDQLKTLAGPEASATVIRFLAPSDADATALIPQPSARTPHAVTARPPKLPTLPEAPRHAAPSQPEPVYAETPATPIQTDAPFPVPEADMSPAATRVATPTVAMPAMPTEPGEPTGEPAVAEQARATFERISETASKVVQTSREGGSSVLERASLAVRRSVRDAARAVLVALLAVTNFLSGLLEKILPEPDEEGRQGISTEVAVGMAILIPLVIVIVVVGLALSQQGRTEFERYLDRARSAHQEALRLSGTGGCPSPDLRPTWAEVMRLADQAAKFRPDDAEVMVIRADAQNFLDCFDRVQRRDVRLLREFEAGADLVGPVVHVVELYTLDRKAGAVYHDTLNETGDGLTSRGETIIQRGQAVNVFTVGDLFDIEWLEHGGTANDNVLIALDRGGVLVAYSSTFFLSAQQLVIEGRWVDPVAIAVFNGNLYVLDPGANQIWRYVPPAGERRYSNAPEEYFTGETRPSLVNAVDFGISETGDVYILFSDGSIQKYRGGEAQAFAYSQQPQGTLTNASHLLVDNDPASRNLYIIDPDTATIYETSWAGTFQGSYRPRNVADAFRGITSFYADSVVRNNMYVVAGNRLYHFHRN